jgi:hypothetical protein
MTISRRLCLSRLLLAAAMAPLASAALADLAEAKPKGGAYGGFRRCWWRNGRRICRIVRRSHETSEPSAPEVVTTTPPGDPDPTGGETGPIEDAPVLK